MNTSKNRPAITYLTEEQARLFNDRERRSALIALAMMPYYEKPSVNALLVRAKDDTLMWSLYEPDPSPTTGEDVRQCGYRDEGKRKQALAHEVE